MKIKATANSLYPRKPDYLSSFIRSIRIFSSLNDNEVEQIKNLLYRKICKKGETIFFEGEKDPPLYLVESGAIKIFKTSPEGREKVFRIVNPQEVFCVASTFQNSTPANAAAMQDSMMFAINKEDLIYLISISHNLSFNLIQSLSEKLIKFAAIIEDLSFSDVTNRVIKALKETMMKTEKNEYVCSLTQCEVASIAGTTREVACRVLKKLESMGMIECRYHNICIIKPDRLFDVMIRCHDTP